LKLKRFNPSSIELKKILKWRIIMRKKLNFSPELPMKKVKTEKNSRSRVNFRQSTRQPSQTGLKSKPIPKSSLRMVTENKVRKAQVPFKPQMIKSSRSSHFVQLNATNVALVKDVFNSIHPQLYTLLADTLTYSLYQFEGEKYEIFLVPQMFKAVLKSLSPSIYVYHAGIHLGFMRRKQTQTGFERTFFLSYEGGDFLLNLIKKKFVRLLPEIQTIKLNEQGEKIFLYGGEIRGEHVISDMSQLKKKNLIFVQDQEGHYIGLALLMVLQAKSTRWEDTQKKADITSRSSNFILKILNLTDAGHFLRDGI
jgi:ribosome biogenesis protein Nip4